MQAAPASADSPLPQKTHFDLQAHRGGIGLTTESTLRGFAKAIELGVTTLELDAQVTQDEKVVVTHDRQVNGVKCRDTAPAFPGDPEFPYAGDFITNLTLAQIKTLECGYQALPDFPNQEVVSAPPIEQRDVFTSSRATTRSGSCSTSKRRSKPVRRRTPRRATCSFAASGRRSAMRA
jgi:glycerophosphoryl diester phosphodiesterase